MSSATTTAAREKQDVLDEICRALGLPRLLNSAGGTVTAKSLGVILGRLGFEPKEFANNAARTEAILGALGEPFDLEADTSRGNTVTKAALVKMRRGAAAIAASGELLPAAQMHGLKTPTTDAALAEARAAALEAQDPPREPPTGKAAPRTSTASRTVIERDPEVIAWVRRHANGHCELCGEPAPFNGSNGLPFLEVHHVRPLAKGGSDQVTNAVALCPNCHRACHHSEDSGLLPGVLYAKVARLERE